MTQYSIRARGATELVESVEAAVVSGALAPGQRLPSVRSLAAHIGLSPGTVASGIAELRRRGVVVTEPRRGARIGPAPPLGGSSRLPPKASCICVDWISACRAALARLRLASTAPPRSYPSWRRELARSCALTRCRLTPSAW